MEKIESVKGRKDKDKTCKRKYIKKSVKKRLQEGYVKKEKSYLTKSFGHC